MAQCRGPVKHVQGNRMARKLVIGDEEKSPNVTGQNSERGKSARHVKVNGRALGQIAFCSPCYHASAIHIGAVKINAGAISLSMAKRFGVPRLSCREMHCGIRPAQDTAHKIAFQREFLSRAFQHLHMSDGLRSGLYALPHLTKTQRPWNYGRTPTKDFSDQLFHRHGCSITGLCGCMSSFTPKIGHQACSVHFRRASLLRGLSFRDCMNKVLNIDFWRPPGNLLASSLLLHPKG